MDEKMLDQLVSIQGRWKMFRNLVTIATKTFLFSVFFLQLFSSQINAGLIPNSWLNSLVLIECQKEENFKPLGTGFLVESKGYKTLVTNAHVLRNAGGSPVFIRVNKKDPKPKEDMFERIKIFPMADSKLKPIFHKKADLAVLYVSVPNTLDLKSVKVGEIHDIHFLKQEDVPLGDEVLLIGFPTGIEDIGKIQKEFNIPIIRGGLVSAKFRSKGCDLFLIDAPSYWGSSGGPVILRPSLYNITKDPSGDIPPKSQVEPRLIGVVSSMLPVYKEWDVTKKPPEKQSSQERLRVISGWHSGLSVVVPVDYLIELLDALPIIE
jgi:hypothetical protein